MRLAPEADGMSLGTCMLLLRFYEPLHVAEQVSLLDAACGGRAILGVAPGWQKDEFEVMGLDHAHRIRRYTEAVDLIKRLINNFAMVCPLSRGQPEYPCRRLNFL
jgi:alkanesulfonate monooxygenase SsuD/methylene tetrahydromethanopterin reductase-like flavin-dependent oxidoreductase (luciferase family)